MNISLEGLGKRYVRTWIFRNISTEIPSGSSLAITGPNGSGKSTLLKILSSFSEATEGKILYSDQKHEKLEEIQTRVSYCAPYLNVIDEMTLLEHLEFHAQFKAPLMELESMCKKASLSNALNKHIGFFSSGMKQRLKLILAIYFYSELLLLDEPTSNMDEEGQSWYKTELSQKIKDQTTIIASNTRFEFDFCQKELNIFDYKNHS